MAGNIWALIAVLVCGAVFLLSVLFIILGLTHKNSPGTSCSSNNQCNPTQECTDQHCVQIPCATSSDCGPSQTCSQGFCFQNACTQNSDCGTGTVCQGQLCVPYGESCSTSQDCNGGALSCINNFCVQCATNTNCGSGVCSDGVCFDTCSSDPGACPSGTTCVNNYCCPASNYPNTCSQTGDCGSGFCVNGACTCVKGNNGDSCVSSTDCASGICLGNICVNSGDGCAYNFNPNISGPQYCPSEKPYCGDGQCSTESLGAPCSCFESSSGSSTTCSQFQACNSGVTGITTTYCINSVCSLTPGWAGDGCTSNFDCAPITGQPNCSNGRCS